MDPRFSMNAFGSHTEVISIPDRMVGLIIGKGGEQITAIQTESDCKVQFAPDSSGLPERPCNLTGTAEAIQKAKELINRIMHKSHDMPGGGGGNIMMGDGMHDGGGGGQNHLIEMMIPGNKAGIIIGKGGDTIKQLQERAGVRMVIIQESNSPTNYDKPLRITGDRLSCQRARDMVLELLAEKDMMIQGGGGGGSSGGGFGDYGHRNNIDLPVPRSLIGIVIGKGGEMIKKIQQESGARLQFKPDDEMGGPNRICSIMGTQEQTAAATNMIQELVENAMQRQVLSGGDWGRSPRSMDGGGSGRIRFGNGGISDETMYSVPADKCGLVIGKGGETIREICRQSGAHVELNRDQSASSLERVFRIQGTPEQIRQAIQLVSEKAGVTPPRDGQMVGGVGLSGMGVGGMGGVAGLGGVANIMSAQPSIASIYGQPASQTQQATLQNILVQTPYQYQQYNQATATDIQNGTDKQTVDANAAAWAAYYAQYYSQLSAAQQPSAATAALQQSQYSAVLPRSTVTPQPSLGLQQQQQPATAQPDYTAAWADYYRAQGLHQQAQAILMQSAAAAGLGLQQQPQ